ncbi:MAG: hypothetical protein HeimAB125_09720 [Candidatus Heimdallarchaeota archaeon AB_125]|nr:MAG: hypothetical protein HeimAB125_09720 [Candidatus Heimdallarchaeota archaeon AB_125]
MKLLDRKLLKEKERELKEEVRGKPYHKTIVPKLRFVKQVFKLVFEGIKSNRPFSSKKKTNVELETN